MSWVVTLPCTRAEAEALAGDLPALAMIEPPPSLVTSEVDEAAGIWRLDAYFEERPDAATLAALQSVVPSARNATLDAHELAEEDWVTLSQSGLAPVRAGRFFIHTGQDQPLTEPGIVNLRIDASRAFGTGHHETTANCVLMLDRLHRHGRRFRAIADIGTGTGLLAFVAHHQWPRARLTATDIDPDSIAVTRDNAAINTVTLGGGRGALALAVADGTDHPLLQVRAPYDLICANILAGPLITLAPALAAIAAPGGSLVLAGLLERQRTAVVAAYRRAGFRFDHALGSGDWPALLFTRRQQLGWRRPLRSNGRGGLPPGDYGSW